MNVLVELKFNNQLTTYQSNHFLSVFLVLALLI